MKVRVGSTIHGDRYEVTEHRGFAPGNAHRQRLIAHDTILRRDVSVIVGLPGDEALLAEARAGAKLGGHPNLVTVLDVGIEAGRPFITTETIEGFRLIGGVEITLDQTLSVCRETCAALQHAHSHDVAHGALGRSSVWRGSDWSVKVSGFRLSAATPAAVAADLRSLGALMLDLVTCGRPEDETALASAPASVARVIRDLLDSDLNWTASMAADLLSRLGGYAGVTVGIGDYVGRVMEAELLDAALNSAFQGEGRIVFVAGEPGIGKTRIAQELAARARDRGADVLWGRSVEGQSAPPYWPWVEAIRSFRNTEELMEITAFLSDTGGRQHDFAFSPKMDSPRSVRFAQFDAVASFLRGAAEQRTLVLVLDDLHCADEPSLQLLVFVAGQIQQSHMLILCTYRDTELRRGHPLSGILADLGREDIFQRVLLRGFSQPEVHQFMNAFAGTAVDAGLASAVSQQTEGNPLFVSELVRLLNREGGLANPKMLDNMRGLGIPEGVMEMIGMRLDRLSEPTNRVLALASVIGTVFGQAELAELVQDEKDLADCLNEALEEGILVDASRNPGDLCFHHSLIREVLYDEFTSIQRAQLHLRFAETILQRHSDDLGPYLSRLADHYLAAVPGGAADEAVKYCRLAGNRAMHMLAFEDAVRYFSYAREIAGLRQRTDSREQLEILQSLGEAQIGTDDLSAAWKNLQRVFTMAASPELIDLKTRAAIVAENAAYWAGLPQPRLTTMLRECLSQLSEEYIALRARATAALARVSLSLDMMTEARLLGQEAVLLARETGDEGALWLALLVQIMVNSEPSARGARLKWALESLAAAEAVGDRNQIDTTMGHLILIHLEGGDRQAYWQAVDQKTEIRGREPFVMWVSETHLTCRYLLQGRYDEAASRAETTLSEGLRTSVPSVEGVHGLQMFTIARDRGQLALVRPILERFLSDSTQASWTPGLALLYAELEMAAEAREIFDRVADQNFAPIPTDTGWPGSMAYLAEVCAFLQDEERATEIREMLLPWAHSAIILGGLVVCLGSASRFLGLLSEVGHHWSEAEGHYREALTFNRRLGVRPALVRTRHNFASMLLKRRRGDDLERAGTMIEKALSDAHAMGMSGLEVRLRAMQDVLGQTGKTASNPDGITARELEVLRLIVEGNTNAEIAAELYISEKTVHKHVSSLLTKTGCVNRAEAASYAVRKHLA